MGLLRQISLRGPISPQAQSVYIKRGVSVQRTIHTWRLQSAIHISRRKKEKKKKEGSTGI